MTGFNETQPIYYQLVQKVILQIVRGDLKAGDKLPSVREMGGQFKVNPNTVQRAYADLERLTVVETRRGLGTFVTEDRARLTQLREQLKHGKIDTFIKDMQQMGFNNQEIKDGLDEHLGDSPNKEDKNVNC